MRQGDSRQIALALGISVAIHALILFMVSGLSERVRTRELDSPPLVARLLEVRPVPVSVTARPEPPRAVPEKLRPPERLPVPVPVAPPSVSSRTVPRPSTAASASAPAAIAVVPALQGPALRIPQQSATAPVGRSEQIPTPSALSTSAPEVDALDPASIGQYRNAIIAAARRYRKYLRVAIENNWEGRAEVRLAIDTSGAIASISIRTRSGYEVLDRHALETIRKAKPAAPMPAALRGKGFILDVPVLFSLKEEG